MQLLSVHLSPNNPAGNTNICPSHSLLLSFSASFFTLGAPLLFFGWQRIMLLHLPSSHSRKSSIWKSDSEQTSSWTETTPSLEYEGKILGIATVMKYARLEYENSRLDSTKGWHILLAKPLSTMKLYRFGIRHFERTLNLRFCL
jgi:hypothetical protein